MTYFIVNIISTEQQPLKKQNKNKEQQYLPKNTPEPHQDTESVSKRREVRKNDATPGQSTAQEGSGKATPGSYLQCEYSAASYEI